MNISEGIFILCIVIAVLSYIIFKNKNYFFNRIANQDTIVKNYNISSNTIVKDYIYYRLGFKTESEVNESLYIQSIINSIIQMIKDNNIKYNLQRNKPIFLIGSSARNFDELQSLKNMRTTEGNRNMLDIAAFSPSNSLPGFISNIFKNCDNQYSNDEDIVFHEFMHVIMSDGMTQTQKDILNKIYNKYNVFSNIYNIKSYAFVHVAEFFAEMAQVYCSMTIRLDVTGGITKQILFNYLPEVITFLETIFNKNPNHVLNTICTNCNQLNLCDISES